MPESDFDVSVVLPAYNEAGTLAKTVSETRNALRALDLPDGFEIIIAEDGCTDDTPAVARDMAETFDEVRHLHSADRLGRGVALERALDASSGRVFVYFDTDLATDLDHLAELIAAIRDGEHDIATGSRLMADSDADRPLGRDIPSRGYNLLVRTMLGSSVRDHQCGFKAFDRTVLLELIDEIEADHWFWDTEVLVAAQAAGYDVYEFPVHWNPRGDSTVDVPRDTVRMGRQLLELTWRRRLKPTLRRLRSVIALAITIGLGYLILERVAEPEAILRQIAAMDPRYLAVAAAVYLVSWPIRGLRYRDILTELGYTERVGFLTGAVFVSQTGNLLVPARAGDAVRAYIMKARRNVPYASGFASLAVERLFDLLAISLLAVGVVGGLVATQGTASFEDMVADPDVGGGTVAVGVALVVAAVTLVAFLVLIASARVDDGRFRRFRPSEESRLNRPVSVFVRFLSDVRSVSTNPAAVITIGASSLVIWTIDVLTAVFILAAFGVESAIGPLLAIAFLAVSIGNLAKIVPLSPGGIGLYEAGFAIVVVGLSPIGVTVAVAAAIVDHALKNLITGIGGVVATGALNVSLVTAVREGQAGRTAAEITSRE